LTGSFPNGEDEEKGGKASKKRGGSRVVRKSEIKGRKCREAQRGGTTDEPREPRKQEKKGTRICKGEVKSPAQKCSEGPGAGNMNSDAREGSSKRIFIFPSSIREGEKKGKPKNGEKR